MKCGLSLRFRKNNKNRPVVDAPKPIIEYTSKRVLVEDHIEGINGLNHTDILKAGYDIDDFVGEVYLYLSGTNFRRWLLSWRSPPRKYYN